MRSPCIEIHDSCFSDRHFYSHSSGTRLPQNAAIDGKVEQTQTSAFEVGRLTDCDLNNILIETYLVRGGGGIAVVEYLTTQYENYGIPGRQALSYIYNSTFRYIKTQVDGFMSWDSGSSPQMACELYQCELFNVVITLCEFNSVLSLATSSNRGNLEVSFCRWQGVIPNQPFYSIECNTNNTVVHHCSFLGGSYPIYASGANSGTFTVHSYLFDTPNESPIINWKAATKLRFYNNTIFSNSNITPFLDFSGTENPGNLIVNNIFVKLNSPRPSTSQNPFKITVGLNNNLYYQFPKPSIDITGIIGKPVFVNSSAKDYRLASGSPGKLIGT
ncbi:hypothetical protein WKK05_03880 [Nostoc sp. UHCC 0302]|uniref:hypothetical protein n=1 Tax=Nostoc sp. UHCC 0302 TaxID=3134896 RepID=UPI00311CBCF1